MNPGKSDYSKNFQRYELAKYYKKIGESNKAFDILYDSMLGFVSTFESFLQNGVSSTKSDFYKSLADEEKAKSEKDRNVFIIICIIIFVFCSYVYIHYNSRLKRNREELVAMMEMASTLQNEINESKMSSNLLKENVSKLLQRQLEPLTELCDIYFHTKNKNQKELEVYKKVIDIVHEFQQDDRQNELISIIDKYEDNIFSKIFDDANKNNISFSHKEKSLLLFVLSGFPPTTISLLLNLTMTNYYTTKSRLKSKLLAIDSELSKNVYSNYF